MMGRRALIAGVPVLGFLALTGRAEAKPPQNCRHDDLVSVGDCGGEWKVCDRRVLECTRCHVLILEAP